MRDEEDLWPDGTAISVGTLGGSSLPACAGVGTCMAAATVMAAAAASRARRVFPVLDGVL
jgi:hypothetical protein